jgi:hypothetical protein
MQNCQWRGSTHHLFCRFLALLKPKHIPIPTDILGDKLADSGLKLFYAHILQIRGNVKETLYTDCPYFEM